MPDYICSQCRGPAKPKLDYVGLVADCDKGCIEASLLVLDDEYVALEYGIPTMATTLIPRPLTSREESDLLEELWAEETADWSPAQKANFRVNH